MSFIILSDKDLRTRFVILAEILDRIDRLKQDRSGASNVVWKPPQPA